MSDCSLSLDYLGVPASMYQELASLPLHRADMTLALNITGGKPRSHSYPTPASPWTEQEAELYG